MNRWVVDASVAVKWFVPEPLSQHAARLLDAAARRAASLAAPDLIVAEFGSVLVKKQAAGEFAASDTEEMLGTFLALPVEIVPSQPLAPAALAIAICAGCTFYDALYLAAAQAVEGRLVTADREFIRLISRTALSDLVLQVKDLPPKP